MSKNNIKNKQARYLQRVVTVDSRPTVEKLAKIESKIDAVISSMASKLPRDPMMYREMDSDKVVDALNDFHKRTRSQYLYSMIHPDYAVTEGIQVKLYSDVPVPTSSIGIRSMYQLKTSENGTICLQWSPNFLAAEADIGARFDGTGGDPVTTAYSNLTYINDASLNGDSESQGLWYALPSYIPAVMLQKYRLVSALIKVKYNGSVLNQAGTMISCATFDSLPVYNAKSVSSGYDANYMLSKIPPDANRSRYTDFSLIRNGLWNYSRNITADANGIECLYVPTDPTSNIFYDLASYYGTTLNKITPVVLSVGGDPIGYVEAQVGDFGSQLNYMIAGYNLPPSSNCIQVEIFYNFEVISDPSVAPLLRSTINQHFDYDDKRRLDELFRELSKKGLIRRVWDKVKEGFPAFAKATVTWGPRILPLINKLL